MEKFETTILGCGSATPSTKHLTSSQVVNVREKLFMIDCGEGTQTQLRRSKIAFGRINHIFISHTHGDHCFGLPGMISSFGLLDRTAPLFIHGPASMEKMLRAQIEFYCPNLEYPLNYIPYQSDKATVIYEDRSLTIETIPLLHRVPTSGFLFRERPLPDHLNREMANYYRVPIYEYNRIKNGADFITSDGRVIPHNILTTPATPPRSYAYCCDTGYNPSMIEQIKGVDTIYHDCTYSHEDVDKAKRYLHSTSVQAATIAAAAECRQLILGHFSARYNDEEILLNEAQAIFPNTLLANENSTFTIG